MRAASMRRLIPIAAALVLSLASGCAKAEEPASADSSVATSEAGAESGTAESVTESGSETKEESATSESETKEESSASSVSESETTSSESEEVPEEIQDQVASSDDYAETKEVVSDDMVPVTAAELADGTYEIEVESSSSMFRIVHCDLIVENGEMRADITLSGKGYLYVYPGTGVEAATDSEGNYIGFEENEEGLNVHRDFPVEALNQEVDCAAFSKRKEKWYDRKLVFLADGLPDEAYAAG